MDQILIGISSCLLGEPVRYDGGHKYDSYINGPFTDGAVSQYFRFVPMCPEVAIGLGVPRPTIQLIQKDGDVRAVGTEDSEHDVTERLRRYADSQKALHQTLCGYILKSRSPSCGMADVKVHRVSGPAPRIVAAEESSAGIYAARLMANLPELPVEEEERLRDPAVRENFITRVYIYHRWRILERDGVTTTNFANFHTRHESAVMRHDPGRGHELQDLVASCRTDNLDQVSCDYFRLLMKVLRQPPLQHNHSQLLSPR